MDRFLKAGASFFSDESRRRGLNFTPQKDDVILASTPKAGTSWLQQICHGLRSDGGMNFEEISEVIPCLEFGLDEGHNDLQAQQSHTPRMFRTHFWYPDCPKDAHKCIVLIRRPSDCALSYFYFFENWFFKKGKVSVEDFVTEFYLKRGEPSSGMEAASIEHYIRTADFDLDELTVSWYPHRHDANVLWLHYEDLRQDLRSCVRLIAEFLGIGEQDSALQDLVTKQASFEFMKSHSSKFDVHVLKRRRNPFAGLPENAGTVNNPGRIRSGGNDGDVLPDKIQFKMDEKWLSIVSPKTGFANYDALRNSINRELGRNYLL